MKSAKQNIKSVNAFYVWSKIGGLLYYLAPICLAGESIAVYLSWVYRTYMLFFVMTFAIGTLLAVIFGQICLIIAYKRLLKSRQLSRPEPEPCMELEYCDCEKLIEEYLPGLVCGSEELLDTSIPPSVSEKVINASRVSPGPSGSLTPSSLTVAHHAVSQ